MPNGTSRPWARNYEGDPATRELVRRRVDIPHHQELHEAAASFLDPPFKIALGRANTEILGMHHYTVHMKIGHAREYLDEFRTSLSTHGLDPTAQSLTFNKHLTGFFASLLSSIDNLVQELNLIYDLGLKESDSMEHIKGRVDSSRKRKEKLRDTPMDRRISRISEVLSQSDTREKLTAIGRYRNFLTHKRIPTTLARGPAARESIPPPSLGPHSPAGQALAVQHYSPTVSGGANIPSGSLLQPQAPTGQQTQQPLDVGQGTRLFLPRLDKLDVLPSEARQEDLDSREIVDICEDLYQWILEFLGSVYEMLVEDFRSLS